MSFMDKFGSLFGNKTTGFGSEGELGVKGSAPAKSDMIRNTANSKGGDASVVRVDKNKGTSDSRKETSETKSLSVAQLICNKHMSGESIEEISRSLELVEEYVTGVINEAKSLGLYEKLASFE